MARVRVRVGEEDFAVPVWLWVAGGVSAVVSEPVVVSELAVVSEPAGPQWKIFLKQGS